MIAGILALAAIVLVAAVLINGAYWTNVHGYDYQQKVQKYFEKADRAATLSEKSTYFDQYISALEANNLTTGKSTQWPWPHDTSSLDYNFEIAKSLQNRLHNATKISADSFAYADQNRQIIQEFCWFPTEPFYDAYMMNHGIWKYGEHSEQINKCAPPSK